MGNCRSSPASGAGSHSSNVKPPWSPVLANSDGPSATISPCCQLTDEQSPSALIQALLPVVLPIAREFASQKLILEKTVVYEEGLVERLDKTHLPVEPIDVSLHHIRVLTPESLEHDMKQTPEFGRPEGDRYRALMKQPDNLGTTDAATMVVFDITGVLLTLRLARGIEIAVPVEGQWA